MVVDEDEPSTDIFFVASGAVRVQLRAASGREVLLNEFGAGEFFGELSAIDGAPRAANVTAVARSRLCIIPAQAFLAFVFANPTACHALLRTLAAKLRLQTERTLEREALPVRLRSSPSCCACPGRGPGRRQNASSRRRRRIMSSRRASAHGVRWSRANSPR